LETRDPKSLHPHPLSVQIYRDGATDELRDSIKAKGIYEPLLITWDNTVVSGHRRLACALELGLEAVPVTDTGLTDPLDIEEAVIEANRYREKTTEQKAREFIHLLVIETKRAKDRQAAAQMNGKDQQGEPVRKQQRDGFGNPIGDDGSVRKNSSTPTDGNGRAKDAAASRVGMSRPTAEQASQVVAAIDTLESSGKQEQAAAIRETLNKKSTRKALAQAKASGALAPKAQPEKRTKGAPPKQHFNQTNDKIEWARWTWNPVTGCEHDCPYCYARDIAEPPSAAFPHGFKPALREERLTAPRDMGNPEDHLHKLGEDARHGIGYKTVFAVSMGDLFGEWVPQDWIDRVLSAVREAPAWNFLFLTKNPERMAGTDFPPNAWAGTTVDCQDRVKRAQDAFCSVSATVRFLSCEPLTEEVVFTDMSMFDWLIIGGRSKSDNLPAAQPELFWAASLMVQAASFGCRVYCKPNLTVIKQYPQ